MHEHPHDMIPTGVYIIHTEVEIVQSRPRRMSLRLVRRWRQWWTEERLALLAVTVGNAFFLGLVLWWMW